MADEHLRDTIEKYLLGELSEAESARLEADIAANVALFEQVEIQRLGLMGMRRLTAADLREKFARWDEELDAQPLPPVNRNIWRRTTGILLLLLMAGAFWHFWQSKATQEKQLEIARKDSIIAALEIEIQQKQAALSALLAKSRADKDSLQQVEIKRLRQELNLMDKVLRTQKSDTKPKNQPIAFAFPLPPKFAKRGDSNDVIGSASEAFDNGQFSDAERLLKSIPPDDEGQQRMVTQMLPYALFYDGKFGEAAVAFIKLKNEDMFEAKKAEWYLLLCYVNERRDAHTQKVLAEILSNPNHSYYKEAERLRDELNKK